MKAKILAASVFLSAAGLLADDSALVERARYFGLDPAVAGWEAADADRDGVANRAELEQGTDPLSEDTDRDGFRDGIDLAPLSRVYIEWGSPFFTQGDNYRYLAPSWFVGAFRKGGLWTTNEPGGWQSGAAGGSLVVVINPELEKAVLTVEVELEDAAGSDVRAALADGAGALVAADLAGNLIVGSGGERQAAFKAPVAETPGAVALVLEHRKGVATVYRTMLYVDEDGDGLDREQEAQLGTSDRKGDSDGDGLGDYEEFFKYGSNPALVDSDGDGMPDGWEVAHRLNPAAADGSGDSDGDGWTNGEEYRLGLNPDAAPVPDVLGVIRLRVGTPLEADTGGEE